MNLLTEGAVTIAIQQLLSPDPAIRLMAVHFLGDHRVQRAKLALVRLFGDPDQQVRKAAVQAHIAMRDWPDPREQALLSDLLLGYLKSDERIAAIYSLGSEELLPYLTPMLADPDGEVRKVARWMIHEYGFDSTEMIQAVSKLLQHPDPGVRMDVLACFILQTNHEHIISHVIHPLIMLLADPSRAVRCQAGRMLMQVGQGYFRKWSEAAGAPVERNRLLLEAGSAIERSRAILVLSDYHEELLPDWLNCDPTRRLALAVALGRRGTRERPHHSCGPGPAASATRAVAEIALGNPILQSTASLNTAPGDVTPQLIELLADESPDVRAVAAIALQLAGDQTAIPHLEAALRDEDENVRGWACMALGWIGTAEEGPIQSVAALLNDTCPEVRRAAARAFWKLGPTAAPALPGVLKGLMDRDSQVQSWLIQAIAAIRPSTPDAIWRVLDALDSMDDNARFQAKMLLVVLVPELIRPADPATVEEFLASLPTEAARIRLEVVRLCQVAGIELPKTPQI